MRAFLVILLVLLSCGILVKKNLPTVFDRVFGSSSAVAQTGAQPNLVPSNAVPAGTVGGANVGTNALPTTINNPATGVPAPGAVLPSTSAPPVNTAAPVPITPAATAPAPAAPIVTAPPPPAPAAPFPKPDIRVIREDTIIRPGTGTSVIIQTDTKDGADGVRASLQDFAGFRDPFKSPELQATVQGNVTQLEKYILTEYKLTGVMTGPRRMRAMILSPDGKAHFVSEGMKLGNRGGIIKKITTKSVVVSERSVNALGEEEFTRTELGLAGDPALTAGK